MSREYESPRGFQEPAATQKPVEQPELPEVLHEEITISGLGPFEEGTEFIYHRESGTYRPKVDDNHPHRNFLIPVTVMYGTESLTIQPVTKKNSGSFNRPSPESEQDKAA